MHKFSVVILKHGRQQHLNTPGMLTGLFTTKDILRMIWDFLKI